MDAPARAIAAIQNGWLAFWVLLLGLIGSVLGRWIITRPAIMEKRTEAERQRALEEAERHRQQAEDFDRLRSEIARLAARVEGLEAKCDYLQRKVDECEDDRIAAVRRAETAEAELAKERAVNAGLGTVRQVAQAVVSADRVEEAQAKKRRRAR